MQILGRFCLLITVFSVFELYRRILQIFIGFFPMDSPSCIKFLIQSSEFGCGFLVFGCFSRLFNLLGLFLMFGLGLKFLQMSWFSKCLNLMQLFSDFRGKAGRLGNGFGSKCGFGEVCYPKVVSCKCGAFKFLENSRSPNADVKAKLDAVEENDVNDGNEENECYSTEDEEFDVTGLRKSVKTERKKANEAQTELEKERMAAASAAEEAMTMILRLQSEKSCVEMQANQYRRMAEQKQQYDEAIIQSLQWIVMKHESERSLLEDQLRFCRQELKLYRNNADDHERDSTEEAISSDHF